MFSRKHSEHKRKRGFGVFGLVRVFISLVMMSVLFLGFYQAYKSFSGVDPLTANPESILKNFLTSDSAYEFVTGLLSFSPQTSLTGAKKLLGENAANENNPTSNSPILFKFAVVSDSHKDNKNLESALQKAKGMGVEFVIGLGDFSDVGTVDELSDAKLQFDVLNLPYYVTAGDHDLWDSRDKENDALRNFKQVFGSPYQSFTYKNTRILIFYNSDNYIGVDDLQLKWIQDEIDRQKQEPANLFLVFTGIPLYHPSSDHVMGKTTPKLRTQADHLASIFAKAGVAEVITGDTHFFSRYKDPKTGMKMTSVGAVTSVRNAQSPRFSIIEVKEDGSYNLHDVEI